MHVLVQRPGWQRLSSQSWVECSLQVKSHASANSYHAEPEISCRKISPHLWLRVKHIVLSLYLLPLFVESLLPSLDEDSVVECTSNSFAFRWIHVALISHTFETHLSHHNRFSGRPILLRLYLGNVDSVVPLLLIITQNTLPIAWEKKAANRSGPRNFLHQHRPRVNSSRSQQTQFRSFRSSWNNVA